MLIYKKHRAVLVLFTGFFLLPPVLIAEELRPTAYFQHSEDQDIINPENAYDGDPGTYAKIDCVFDSEPSLTYHDWQGAPELGIPADNGWIRPGESFSWEGGEVQDEPELEVVYKIEGLGDSECAIIYFAGDWGTLVDWSSSTGTYTASVTLPSGVDFSMMVVDADTRKRDNSNGWSKDLLIYDIRTRGELSDIENYEFQVWESFEVLYLSTETADTGIKVDDLGLESGIYWWRVRAGDEKGNYTKWSSPRRVNVDSAADFEGLVFRDEYPTPEWRYGDILQCYITAASSGEDEIDNGSVRYRVSADGEGLENFSPWRSDAVLISSGPYESRFLAEIPNASGDRFYAGEDNYIEWQIKDSTGNILNSGPYNLRIRYNTEPVLDLVQPVDFSGTGPVVELRVLECPQGLDPGSISISITEAGTGEEILNVSGSETPSIYDPEENLIFYSWPGGTLNSGKEYLLYVSASDKGYVDRKTAELETVFTARGEGVSGLASYPNPFNSRREKASLRYTLAEDSRVTINIYDSSRTLVKTVIRGAPRSRGMNIETWDGRVFNGEYAANGVYYCEIIAEGTGISKRYTVIAVHSR